MTNEQVCSATIDSELRGSDVVAIRVSSQRFVTCLMTVLASVPFGVRAGRRIVTTGVPLATRVNGPVIQFQIGARFKKEITITGQDNQDTKYTDDLAAYRTALRIGPRNATPAWPQPKQKRTPSSNR
jgi:hypothetical protein